MVSFGLIVDTIIYIYICIYIYVYANLTVIYGIKLCFYSCFPVINMERFSVYIYIYTEWYKSIEKCQTDVLNQASDAIN